jgi:exopolysaccharide biosynthesis operon protein EpsL
MRKRFNAGRRRRFFHHCRLHCLCLAALASLPNAAHADADDTLNFVAGASLRYDDNLFRLPDGADPTSIGGESKRSDQIFSTYAGIRLNKALSLQRFQLDATYTNYRYQTYDQLDFSGLDYQARWLWALTPRLTGTLAAGRREEQIDFADFRVLSNDNTQINETRYFLADWWATGGWHVVAGVSTLKSRNAADFTAVGSFRQDGGEAGIRYVSSADNSIAAVRREARGEFKDRVLDVNQLDTGYDQNENELRVVWRPTGKSTLEARLAYLERQHDHFPARDFSGGVGRLSYHWLPTGKVQLRLEAARDLVSFQEQTHSYYVSRNYYIEPIWLMTAKTSLRLRFNVEKRDYRGALPSFAALETREDTYRSAQLSFDWQPRRFLVLAANLAHEERESNLPGHDYDADTAGLSVELRF